MSPAPHHPRAFTLLEVVMASALGGIILVAIMGLFAALDRTDRGTARHFDAQVNLQRLHLVMERAFSDMVMASSGVPTAATLNTDQNTPDRPPDSIVGGEAAKPLRARVLIEPDPRAPAAMGGGLTPIPGATRGAPAQRLEIVLTRPPIPAGFAAGLDIAGADDATAESPIGPVRGVFELRPDAMTPRDPQARPLDPQFAGWTLWWRPLPAGMDDALDAAVLQEPFNDPAAVPIASGLAGVRWVAFKDKQRLTQLAATQMLDLPGFMEMEVRTTTGLYANWMFEIGWSTAAEPGDPGSEQNQAQPEPQSPEQDGGEL